MATVQVGDGVSIPAPYPVEDFPTSSPPRSPSMKRRGGAGIPRHGVGISLSRLMYLLNPFFFFLCVG